MIVNSSDWPDLQLLEAAPILVWRSGADGLCDWFNSSWLAYTGRTLAQELGNGWTEGVHPEDFGRCLQIYLEAFGRRAPFEMEYRILRACGTYGWIVDCGVPIFNKDHQFLGYVGYCFDITARRENEEKIDIFCHDLERSNAELEQFAYAASHDLREPLRMVVSYSTLLKKKIADHLDEDSKEFFGYIERSAKRMDEMIRDLLDYSRVERHGNNIVSTKLFEAVEYALQNLSHRIKEQDAEIKIDFDPALNVMGDAHQLARLFQNLIGNALKYYAAETPPRICLTAEAAKDGMITLAVEDNGIGIPAEFSERIFQLFQRLHTREVYDGTGVGLSICRKIVDRHGGKIWVSPAPGGGSIFRFTLPVPPG